MAFLENVLDSDLDVVLKEGVEKNDFGVNTVDAARRYDRVDSSTPNLSPNCYLSVEWPSLNEEG